MAMFHRIANLFRRTRIDGEIAAELQAHLEMRIDDNVAAGMSREEARRAALLRFGNPAVLMERTFAADAALALSGLWFDLRYAVRQLRKAPIFAAATILTLALGIGATTAIFSAMNAVLLRLLPVAKPGELYYLHVPEGQPRGARNTGDSETSFSLPVFEALRHDQRAFAGVAAFAPVNIEKVVIRFGEDSPELASGEMVSGNFFSLLGVSAHAGRLLGMADETQHAPVAVLNYAYWTRRFSRNPAVLGETISIKGVPFTVVGIAAPGFPGSEPGEMTDLWIPLPRRPELAPWGNTEDKTIYGLPNWWCLRLISRLAPGVSAAQAVSEATPAFQAAAYASLGTPDPAFPKVTLQAVPAKGIQGLGDYYREPITILMVLVTLVLVIACSNVAMLLVARNASRRRDFSLRLALGAGRAALLRQLLVESALLVVSGAVSGWLFALYATRALAAWSHLGTGLSPDSFVLVFTGIISVLAALLFGMAPMRTAAGGPVAGGLRTNLSTSHQGVRGGNAVLTVQVALCFTLLAAAGLMVRTLHNFERTDLGMRTDQLVVFGVTPQGTTTDPQRFAFYRELLDRVRALPGVESATFIENRPGAGWSNNDEPTVDGVSYAFDRVPLRTNNVGPDFLRTMGIPLLAGRDLRDSDTPSSPRVVLINETFVKKLLPRTNPLGHQLGDLKKHPYTIVGVAADSKYRSVDEAPRAMAYYPYTQTEEAPSTIQVEVRTGGDSLSILPSAERALHELNPNLPLEKPMKQAAVFEDSYAQQRLFSRLAMFFALLAGLLVAIGLYGTLSYRISRRNAEIGVRMALGARRSQVLTSILQESFRIAGIGIAAGVPLALLAGHFMSSMLYKLQPYDLASLLAALGGIIVISLAAAFFPARRAASIDPAQALRTE